MVSSLGNNKNVISNWNTKQELPKISQIDKTTFRKTYLNKLLPVVITESVDNWVAKSRWTPEFFREKYRNKRIKLDGEEFELSSLIDQIIQSTKESPAPYIRHRTIHEEFKEIASDAEPRIEYAIPDRLESVFLPKGGYAAGGKGFLAELYIGGPGAGFPALHFDVGYTHAIATQIYGKKEFILFPPSQGKYLYPDSEYSNKSTIENVFEPDFERYPLLKNAEPIFTTLEPGESLFIPAHWWHTTMMHEISISVSTSFVSSSCWKMYWEYIRKSERTGRSLAKSIAKDIYLRIAGSMMTIHETFIRS